jgi:hypothetical protein
MIGQYNLPNLLNSYVNNQHIIKEHFQYRAADTTGQDNTDGTVIVIEKEKPRILGLSIQIFLFLLILSIAIWITAFVLLIKNWKKLNNVALFFALLTLFTNIGGPIFTILIIYFFRKN